MAKGILGIDIGGSGIKGNVVDPEHGLVTFERHKIPTPQPSTPDAVADTVFEMVQRFSYAGPVGCTFPAIVKRGIALSAANVDQGWIGTDAAHLFEKRCGMPFTVVNDADAAGIAEVEFGAAKDVAGVVIVLTFGTGIGSGLFMDGVLVPNTEFGHLELADHESVEDWASARAKEDESLSYKQWARRLNALLAHLDRLFSPDLFVIGGGISRKWDRFETHLDQTVTAVPALLQNEAGIIGAVIAAARSA